MKEKKTNAFTFYFPVFYIYLFLSNYNQSNYSAIIFIFILILFRRTLTKKLKSFESKLYLLLNLFIYQTVFPINLGKSINTLQLLILSRKMIILSGLLFLIVCIFFLINQNILNTSYVNSNHFAINPSRLFKEKKQHYSNLYDHGRDTVNRENMKYLVSEIPRHGYLRYTSQYNLSDHFFSMSKKSIEEDNHLYIILSNTGSPASEVISLFTQKTFNHLSLSFDRNLKTMISYNGGSGSQYPGLNTETLDSLYRKEDSQVLVYSLNASKQQQLAALEIIKRINMEGSAYNVLGLITNYSIRPNMMFCSQFVYFVLDNVGLTFFDANNTQVKPTDFIEKDTFNKMRFEYEATFPIHFDQEKTSM